MSAPDQDRTATTPASPSVSTAPAGTDSTTPDVAPGHRWWSNVPRHLGRARTSTVVLGVLFLAVFALWLNVRPPTDSPPRTPSDPGNVNAPVVPGLSEEREQTEPATPATTAPRPTTSAPAPEETEPTGTATPTTTSAPTTGTTPSAPADSTTDETVPSSPTG